MLMPFLQLIFTGNENVVTAESKNAVIRYINTTVKDLKDTQGSIKALGLICLLMVSFIILNRKFKTLNFKH